MDSIYLITRADDLGSYRSANRATLAAYKEGVLRNAGLVVPAPYFEEAAEMLSGEKGLCLGLHAAITCEWNNVRWYPVCPANKVRSLLEPDGTLHRTTEAISKSVVKFDEIMAEIQAQLDIARKRKVPIEYIDAHMGFVWLYEESDKERFLEPFSRWIESEGLVNGCTLGTRLGQGSTATGDPIERLCAQITAAAPGIYQIVGHPAYPDQEMAPAVYDDYLPGAVARMRDIERRSFMDERVILAIKQAGAIPTTFTQAALLTP